MNDSQQVDAAIVMATVRVVLAAMPNMFGAYSGLENGKQEQLLKLIPAVQGAFYEAYNAQSGRTRLV